MATLTLGQILDTALGSAKAGAVDFEQLHNLLNGMLLHLGLRDVPVQENGEPLEGAEAGLFSASFLEELKRKVEANEKEIAEVRAQCQELREEVNEMKLEQSRLAGDMQKMQDCFDMDDFRNKLLESVMSAVRDMMGQGGRGAQQDVCALHRSLDDQGLIVIGNEITLLERSRTSTPRHGGTRSVSPVSPKAKTNGRGKDFLEEDESSHPASSGANDTGQNVGQSDLEWKAMGQSDTGWNDTGWNVGQKDMRRNVQCDICSTGQKDMGWSGVGRKCMGWNVRRSDMGQKDTGRNVQWSKTGRNDMGRNDMGQDDMRQDGMGQIKDDEIKISISKAEALPSYLGVPPGMTDVGEIKDEETKDEGRKMSISKTPPHVQKTTLDGSFTTSGMHPGAPGTPLQVQRVQSVQGHPGSQTLWVPAESVAGTSSRLPTPKEECRGSRFRMEPFPAEAGLMTLKMPSSEYIPCDHIMQSPGRRSKIIPSTPPPSPGLSGRSIHGFKQHQTQERREQAVESYSRRSPRYCGGKHTSNTPVQPMEPLLPDPNKPGVIELLGKDGMVYRGRCLRGLD